MDVGALAFRAQMFRIQSSSWQILPLISMNCLSFSFLFFSFHFFFFHFLSFYNMRQKVDFIQDQNGYSSLVLVTICLENCFPVLYFELVSVFVTEMDFLYAVKFWALLHNHSVSLCLFIGELNPLILRDIEEQSLLLPVTFVIGVGILYMWLH